MRTTCTRFGAVPRCRASPHRPIYVCVCVCVQVIQRVIACNHRSLGASNSVRLQRFLVVLLQYFGACCSSEQAQTSLRRLDVTTASLFQLAQQFPQLTYVVASLLIIVTCTQGLSASTAVRWRCNV